MVPSEVGQHRAPEVLNITISAGNTTVGSVVGGQSAQLAFHLDFGYITENPVLGMCFCNLKWYVSRYM